MSNGKGDRPRKVDKAKYRRNWVRIFLCKKTTKKEK